MAFSVHFPHSSNGQVDWFTLGNIITGELLAQVYAASYLDSKYGRAAEGFVPDTSWEYIGEEHDIVIMKKRLEGTRLDSFMGRGVIDFPVQRAAEVIQDMHLVHNWERYLVEAKLLKRLSEGNEDCIAYRRYESTTCLVKTQADFVHYVRSRFHGEKFVRASVSVEDPSYPEYSGVIRAKMLPGTGFLLEPYNGDPNRTLATYMAGLSLNGLPAIVTNRVVKALPLSIFYLNEYLKRVFVLSPSSNGLIDTTPKSLTLVERCIAPVEEHHLSSLNAPHSEPEQHVAKHSLHNTCHSTTCQEGDAPASIVVSSQVNGCSYCVNCLKDQQEAPIRESMPLLDPDVRMKCSHGTDASTA